MLESVLSAGVEAKVGFPKQQEVHVHNHVDRRCATGKSMKTN